MTTYGNTYLWVYLGSGNGLVPSAITWSNVGITLLGAMWHSLESKSQRVTQISFHIMSLKIKRLKLLPHPPRANDLNPTEKYHEMLVFVHALNCSVGWDCLTVPLTPASVTEVVSGCLEHSFIPLMYELFVSISLWLVQTKETSRYLFRASWWGLAR